MVRKLSELPVGRRARIIAIAGDQKFSRRLMALGLSLGNEVEVTYQGGRGVVLARDGNRVALGGTIARNLQVEEIS